jgi:hypothetical protein
MLSKLCLRVGSKISVPRLDFFNFGIENESWGFSSNLVESKWFEKFEDNLLALMLPSLYLPKELIFLIPYSHFYL